MESTPLNRDPDFDLLRTRLLAALNKRVLNGEFSERGLARLLGVSQPQIHNVLKGERKLHIDLADRIILRLQINLFDLLEIAELERLLILRFSRTPGITELFSTFAREPDGLPANPKRPMGRVTQNSGLPGLNDLKRRLG